MVEPATIMNGERPRPPRVRLTVSESSGHTELMTSGLVSQRGHAVYCKVCNTARCSDRRSVSCLRQLTWSETERENLLLNVHGGAKAYQGRGRVGKGGQKSETSKQAPTWKTKATVDRRQTTGR